MSDTRNAVVLTVDRNMLFPALVVADEVARVQNSEQYDTIVITERGSLPRNFHAWHTERKSRFQVLEVDYPAAISAHPTLSRRFPVSSLFRLQLPDFFGDRYDRILYLDADTRVNRPIAPLFELDMGGLPVAAADDLTSSTLHPTGRLGRFRTQGLRRKAGLPPSQNHRYANTGVLLIDVEGWRKGAIGNRALSFLADHQDLCEFPDQDAFNAALETPYCLLSPYWNCRTDTGIQDYCAEIMTPAIVHYAGYFKPWYKRHWEGDPACAERYTRFFAKTPWPNAPGDPDWIDFVEAQAKIWRDEALRQQAAMPACRKDFGEILNEVACLIRKAGKDFERLVRRSRRGAMARIASALGVPFVNPEIAKRQLTAKIARDMQRKANGPPHILESYLLRTQFDDVRQNLIPPLVRRLRLVPTISPEFQSGSD